MKLSKWTYLPLILGVLMIASCGGDDPTPNPNPDTPISSFQFEISTTNFNEVTFMNFSLNATSYTWDFGDGETSTDKNPVHIFPGSGTYSVSLAASNGTESRSSSKSIPIADPNEEVKKLTGATSKVWKLSRNLADMEFPLQVGPVDRSQIWWALGSNDPLGARPCLMEEEYIFNVDGTFTYDPKGLVFADFGIWSEEIEGSCIDATDASLMVGPNGEDLSAWGPGTFQFDFNVSAQTLTVNGLGAHIGLPKVGNGSEVKVPQNSVTYKITSLETDGSVDKLVLETSLDAAGGYWQFSLVSYDNPSDEPDLGGAPPTANFNHIVTGNDVEFINTSSLADTYSWDFGDGGTSVEESPQHTYGADGSYTVSLTAINGDGEHTTSKNVLITASSFYTSDVIHGNGTKTWKLKPVAGALAVGPGIGSSEWFSTSLDDVNTRSCTFDDEYIFSMNGQFEYKANGDVWAESYMDVVDAGCITEAELSAGAMPWGSGVHTFSTVDGVSPDLSTVTVKGTGAFIGLPKAFNGGEYAASNPAVDGEITYEVLSYIKESNSETLVLTIDISANQDGTAYWTFTLISE